MRPQDPAFTVGCSNGQDPTVVESRITAVNRFLSKPNYTAAVSPPEGAERRRACSPRKAS